MPETHNAVRHNERPLKIFAAGPGLPHRRGPEWLEMDSGRPSRAGFECYNLLTKEKLAVTGWRATTVRVMKTSLRPQTTTDRADTHDGALFRRLEEFFAARRAEVRANKLSAPA